jgi:hypothetical protein
VLPANYASKVALRNLPRALSANWVNAQDDKKDILPINLFAGAPEGFGCRFCNSTLQPAAAIGSCHPKGLLLHCAALIFQTLKECSMKAEIHPEYHSIKGHLQLRQRSCDWLYLG